ncbi:hypothetical protein CVT25_008602 [Psilocybe cyanescens]|uniref:Rhodopsin domain-containing protein n=1 Tax=Psilocybe cyanescens TaxID=93625 RepID=A0A409XL93_PSICY|nr:hypothetical protein CVT25_008602 [Psilocybe cyanescens]
MPLSSQEITVKVCVTMVQAVSITSMIIRLVHRWRIKRMWWDDWVTFVPLLVDCLYLSFMWKGTQGWHYHYGELCRLCRYCDQKLDRNFRVSRVSLALSTARIFPAKHFYRRVALWISGIFLFLCIMNVMMVIFKCWQSSDQNTSQMLPCAQKGTSFKVITLDALAEVILVVTPLVMLRNIRLPKSERRLILALFSSSILSFLGSVAFFVVWILARSVGQQSVFITKMTAQLQVAISLLVCNLLVVTMLFYRISQRETLPDEPQHAPASESRSRQTNQTNDRPPPSASTSNVTPITFTSIHTDSVRYSSPSNPGHFGIDKDANRTDAPNS